MKLTNFWENFEIILEYFKNYNTIAWETYVNPVYINSSFYDELIRTVLDNYKAHKTFRDLFIDYREDYKEEVALLLLDSNFYEKNC